jgi:hypothetical protein
VYLKRQEVMERNKDRARRRQPGGAEVSDDEEVPLTADAPGASEKVKAMETIASTGTALAATLVSMRDIAASDSARQLHRDKIANAKELLLLMPDNVEYKARYMRLLEHDLE